MSNRTIFNELGESRVINPRSGFSQFVDLSNNQTISGIKRFLSNLITNSNVNFNTTANVGRIIFNPNEPAGSGSQIVAIYTEDENDGQGWFFDSVGNLYYLGSGLSPVKIMLSGSTGDLTILSNFNSFGNIVCHNILTSDIISSYSGGNITINNNLALGSNTINSGNITSTGTISGVDISSTNIIYANNVNLTSTGYLNVNNITSSSTTGLYETKIALSNEFIDINDSSLDIVATYIGFASPIQTLSTASKYMYIKPLSTGDFEIKINNIPNVVLETDWAQLATATQMTSSWYSTANVLMGFINPNPPVGVSPTMRIMGTSNQYIYYNTSNNFGNYNSTTSVTNWEISSTGDITCKGLNATAGIIQTTGTISCYGLNSNSGNINTSGSVLTNTINPNSGTTISSTSIWNFKNASNQDCLIITPLLSAPTYRLQLFGTAGGIKKLYYTIGDELGLIELSTTIWKINGAGASTFTSLNCGSGTIQTTGAISGGNISGVDIYSTGIIYVNNITSSSTTGPYQTKIALSNEFIDINNSSLDIVATYIGFASPIQTLSTASKYMYIKPLSTGNFEIKINNIPNVVLGTDWSQLSTATQMTSSWYSTANVLMGFINPNPPAGVSPTMRIMGTSNQYIYYNTSNNFGNYNSTTSITNWEITANGNFTTTGNITASNTLSLRNGSAITNISLDATTTSGNRLIIYGIASGTRYLFFNTSNNIGVFNTSTGTSVWSIDGTTGNITTIGSYSVGSFSATSFLCNSITPLSGTTFTFGITSNCNWLKSVGVNRILMYPSSTSGDIMQIYRVGDTSFTSGYWYFNNSGNFGYITGGITVWELLNTGGLSLRNTLQMVSSAIILSDTYSANSLTDGGTYRNYIKMNTLFTSSTIGSIELSSKYISFVNPYQPLSVFSKYMFILPDSGGNFTQYINNVAGRVLQTDWANTVLRSDYKFESYSAYNYNFHSVRGGEAGFWSHRAPNVLDGGPVINNGNNWVCLGGMENNNGTAIGGGFPNAGNGNRIFTWMIENTASSGKALGICCNRVDSPKSYINTGSQSTGFILLGFFATNRGGFAYSFTGEHSSMVCDEEYNDLMNYNTDDFIGMVVCSSGKIYNLPYDCDGNTYEKQVDNIKSVDCQPMTRLSKKYKDKSVLGVISHIEKVGKNRNDLGATSWTGCLTLDKDERRRIRVASIGEGGIWITNENGNIENGDYITTSNIAGYSTKQDDDLLHNYTIAKATMDCVFDIEKPDDYKTKYLGQGIYASYIACTYHSG